MHKKNSSVIAFMLAISLGLLLSFCILSDAASIPYSEEELQKIGFNKFVLFNNIGVFEFNVSESGEVLVSRGCFTLANTYNYSLSVSLEVMTELSVTDLDENKTPRVHPRISDEIVFYPLPDSSWVVLDEENIIIKPESSCKVYYNVSIPKKKVEVLGNNHGYLTYINIKKGMESQPGMNIGINYNYKIFFKFTRDTSESVFSFSPFYLIPIGLVGAVVAIYFLKGKHGELDREKHKDMVGLERKTKERIPVDGLSTGSKHDVDQRINDLFSKKLG